MAIAIQAKRREREFPRYKIPLAAMIGGQRVAVCDWSVAGLGLADVELSQNPGDRLSVELLIETDGSTLQLSLNAAVIWVDPTTRRAGLQFLDSAEKTAPLAEFADLYLAGRVVHDGSSIFVLGDNMASQNDTKSAVVSPQESPPREGLVGRILGLAVFALVGLTAFAFLSSIVYERLFTFEAVSANVAAETTNVYQPRDGVVEFATLGESVKRGDRLATIMLTAPVSPDQTTFEVLSPCDCYVISIDHPGSSYGRAGDRLITLVTKDAQIYVSVRLPFRRLANLAEKPRISLTYLDGGRASNVAVISIPKVTEYTVTQLEIRVQAGRDLDSSMIGQPVLATFDTAPWN